MSRSRSKMKIGLKQILSGILTSMIVFTSIPFAGFTTFAATAHEVNGGSSQDLINAIDSASAGDTIVISDTVNIDQKINIGKNITLKGNGTLLRAENFKDIMLEIDHNTNVTMEEITIDGNNVKNSTYSAVYILGDASFTMNSGTIKNNKSNNGGGVYNSYGTFTMNGGTISENTASVAGGVYNSYGTVTMNGGTISENTASVIGGVYNSGGTITMTSGTITENTSNKDSGGVENTGTFTMSGGTISKNTAFNGGGINNYRNGTVTMTGGAISENTAKTNGGGVYNSSGTFTVSGGVISQNTAGDKGGGVYNKSTFKVTDGTISENTAGKLGGGLYFDNGTFEVQGTTVIDGNEKNDNVRFSSVDKFITVAGKFSGSIRVKQDFDNAAVKAVNGYTLTQDDADHFFTDNLYTHLELINNTLVYKGVTSRDIQDKIDNAADGDAITIDDTVLIDKTVNINKNITLKGNGTLLRDESFNSFMLGIGPNASVTMEEITIDGNNIDDVLGAAVYIDEGASFTMNSGLITKNGKIDDNVGGVYNNVGTFTMNGGTISENSAFDGSGVYNYKGTIIMNGGVISKNYGHYGSGVYNCEGTFTMNGGEINNNTAIDYGGGVYNCDLFKMNGGSITKNTASTAGGVYIGKDSQFEVKDTAIITDNGKDKADNVRFANEYNCIAVVGKFSGSIGLKQELDKVAVKAADGYNLKQNDASRFFTDDLNAHLELIDNTLIYKDGKSSSYIQDKIDSATDGDTITIDDIVLIDKTVEINKNITLKGNGTLLRFEDFKGKMLNISSKANVTIEEITIDGNNVAGSTGSAVYINKHASFTMNSGTIKNNIADNGSGVYNEGTFKMIGGEISENTASNSGGGVYNKETFTMSGGKISENKSESYSGGISNQSIFTMTGGTITENFSDKDSGGIGNAGTVNMTGGIISGNTTKGNGGGIRNIGTLQISGGVIKENNAQYGGGVYSQGTFKMTDGTISGNTADKLGGGLYFDKGTFEVQDTATIDDNDKNDNVRVDSSDYPIIVSDEYNGIIKLNSEFGNVVVKAADGYTITQGDVSCFKADGSDAYLSFIDNTVVYMKNRTEWGQMIHRRGATYYINEDGRSSAEITGNRKVWLNTKLDGSGSWYCIDNSQGTFKVGSRFYVQVIDDISKYYDKIGSEYRDKIEDGKLKIFLIGVTDPDGKEYTNLDTEINCYVKVDPNWDKDKLKAIFINGEKTESIDIEYMGTIESPSNGDKFAKLTIKHFSPYAIYQTKDLKETVVNSQPTVNEESTLNNALKTGESKNYGYILGLSATAIVALGAVIFIKKKFNK